MAGQPLFTKMTNIMSLINTSICGPGPKKCLPPFICLSRGKPPPEDVLDMFKWFFHILPKMPNLMLIVYLPKIFSSVAGLFHLDPLHLLSAGTVLTKSPVSGVSQVCSCVYLIIMKSMQKYIDMECCVTLPTIQFQ